MATDDDGHWTVTWKMPIGSTARTAREAAIQAAAALVRDAGDAGVFEVKSGAMTRPAGKVETVDLGDRQAAETELLTSLLVSAIRGYKTEAGTYQARLNFGVPGTVYANREPLEEARRVQNERLLARCQTAQATAQRILGGITSWPRVDGHCDNCMGCAPQRSPAAHICVTASHVHHGHEAEPVFTVTQVSGITNQPDTDLSRSDELLGATRRAVHDFEQALPESRAERGAAERATSAFAALDDYLCHGADPPKDWVVGHAL